MIVRDKADLKRCVRAALKSAPAVDTFAPVRWADGPYGVDAMLRTWLSQSDAEHIDEAFQQRCVQDTPLEPQAADTFAALSAMGMPLLDVALVREREKLLGRVGYAHLALDCARVQFAFTPVPLRDAQEALLALAPFAPKVRPLLLLTESDAPPARYAMHFHALARKVQAVMDEHALGGICYQMTEDAREADMLRYCILPLCEERGAVLHLCAPLCAQPVLEALLPEFPALRAIIDLGDGSAQALALCAGRETLLPRVRETDYPQAFRQQGTRFVPFASGATLPGLMIGPWRQARENIARALMGALLPLARTGFPVQSADIERHARSLLGGNILKLYEQPGLYE